MSCQLYSVFIFESSESKVADLSRSIVAASILLLSIAKYLSVLINTKDEVGFIFYFYNYRQRIGLVTLMCRVNIFTMLLINSKTNGRLSIQLCY